MFDLLLLVYFVTASCIPLEYFFVFSKLFSKVLRHSTKIVQYYPYQSVQYYQFVQYYQSEFVVSSHGLFLYFYICQLVLSIKKYIVYHV